MSIKNSVCQLAVAIIVLMSSVESPAQPEDAQTEVRLKIWLLGNELIQQQGFHLTHDIMWGFISAGERTQVDLQLHGNEQYVIVGACDNDCYDMRISFYDSHNNLLAHNPSSTEIPFVIIPYGFNGTYSVRVAMESCASFACNFGVAVFGR